MTIAPDFGAQTIRIRSGAYDKTVVWFEPHDKNFKDYPLLVDLKSLIISLVISKPEYQALPPTKSGYQ